IFNLLLPMRNEKRTRSFPDLTPSFAVKDRQSAIPGRRRQKNIFNLLLPTWNEKRTRSFSNSKPSFVIKGRESTFFDRQHEKNVFKPEIGISGGRFPITFNFFRTFFRRCNKQGGLKRLTL